MVIWVTAAGGPDLMDSVDSSCRRPFKSSMIIYRLGTNTRVMRVAKMIPNPSDMAMGIMKRACLEVSKIMGARPPKVVRVVSRIGRKR